MQPARLCGTIVRSRDGPTTPGRLLFPKVSRFSGMSWKLRIVSIKPCHLLVMLWPLEANDVSFLQIFLSNNTLGIVHEYAAMGTVYDMLKNQGPFPESLARFFFQQLVCGVRYLHERGVAHREIRLKHLLVKSFNFTTSTVPVLKITHFSAAKEDCSTGPACVGPSTSQTRSHSTHSAGSRSQTQGSRGHVRHANVRSRDSLLRC